MMGLMGSMAAKKLAGMGYTRVFNLQGGMMAWEKIGKSLLIRTQ
jgi:rhodanese-related sulfurtransferase